ncbi:serine--tRNA ligase [Candidatus Parcubacteria bacterium]|nr:MAG: serine--tRNA ligase [Candidatus Parcubacteria bacterium]
MLDIKFIRENGELIKEAARKKHIKFDVDKLLEADDARLKILKEVEEMRAKQNAVSDSISKLQDPAQRQTAIGEMRILKEKLLARVEDLRKANDAWKELMLQAPNIPDMSVPEGENDAQNAEVKTWGDIPDFKAKGFEPKDQIQLMQKLDMADFERGTKVAGFRGYFLKNDGALLSYAVWQYGVEFFMKKGGFTPMIVPSLVRKEQMYGTGYLPQGEEDLYRTQDNDYLAGTAEVATMGYYSDEVLDKKDLPKKFLCFSPCFRREAGSYGKDVKGLIRVHEFFKLEQVVLCEADHQESVKWHEWVNRNTEEFVESLGIPYRTVVNCGGDLGLGQVKKYDIELWVPNENKYREISSASYFHDFQTRRLNIRYKDENGKLRFAHSLNSTAVPTPRVLVAIVENFQQADGSVVIPEPLRKYMGKEKMG